MLSSIAFILFGILVALGYVFRELRKLSCRKDYEVKYLLTLINLKIDKVLELLASTNPPEPEASKIEFLVVVDGILQKVEHMFLKVSQNLPVNVVIKDKFGNLAKVDGKPSWALTDGSLASLEVSEDGMSAVLKPSGLVGTFKVQVNADADLGEGVKNILGELDVELLAGEAVSVELSAGTPVDQ